MRGPALLFALALLGATSARAQTVAVAAETPSAQVAFGERRALLEADSTCRLFSPPVRAGLQAGALQARNGLLRAGWTSARIGELERAAIAAARSRACDDARTLAAAGRARVGFEGWARLHALSLRGGARTWTARRAPDANGWTLAQDLGGRGIFGVQGANTTLSVPLRPGESAPSSAEIAMRDIARSRISLFEIPGRRASGLEAGAPSPASARRFLARERRIETSREGARRLVFVFSNDTLAAMAELDPREAAEINIGNNARILVEIGDLAVARAFLAAR